MVVVYFATVYSSCFFVSKRGFLDFCIGRSVPLLVLVLYLPSSYNLPPMAQHSRFVFTGIDSALERAFELHISRLAHSLQTVLVSVYFVSDFLLVGPFAYAGPLRVASVCNPLTILVSGFRSVFCERLFLLDVLLLSDPSISLVGIPALFCHLLAVVLGCFSVFCSVLGHAVVQVSAGPVFVQLVPALDRLPCG